MSLVSAYIDRQLVGPKSMNLQKLKAKLPRMITPRAFALPYGCLQKVLCAPENKELLPKLEDALTGLSLNLHNTEVAEIFKAVQELMRQVNRPADYDLCLAHLWNKIKSSKNKQNAENVPMKLNGQNVTSELTKSNDEANVCIVPSSLEELYKASGNGECWQAVLAVWASLFAMRPWVNDRSIV